MIAEGAVEAGCKFFAGYPITPASGIYKFMIDSLPKRGNVAISSPGMRFQRSPFVKALR